MVNEYFLTSSELKELKSINEWTRKYPEGLVILNERWHFMPILDAKNKICLKKNGQDYIVVSGMELDYPDTFDQKIIKNYSNVYWQNKE